MLPKKNRFTREDFDSFVAQPGIKTLYNKLGTLKYAPEGHMFAVVTSAKHEKRAVGRNRLRRRLYSRFSLIKQPFSGIFYASKHSYALGFQETRTLIDSLIENAAKGSK